MPLPKLCCSSSISLAKAGILPHPISNILLSSSMTDWHNNIYHQAKMDLDPGAVLDLDSVNLASFPSKAR